MCIGWTVSAISQMQLPLHTWLHALQLSCTVSCSRKSSFQVCCCSNPQELKFGIGDGKLNYYLYNWRVRREMAPHQVGLVLL